MAGTGIQAVSNAVWDVVQRLGSGEDLAVYSLPEGVTDVPTAAEAYVATHLSTRNASM